MINTYTTQTSHVFDTKLNTMYAYKSFIQHAKYLMPLIFKIGKNIMKIKLGSYKIIQSLFNLLYHMYEIIY